MSIEGEAQKDLALNTEDAENIVGGKRKKPHIKHAVRHAAGVAGPNINIQFATTPTVDTAPEDCDPGDSADTGAVT